LDVGFIRRESTMTQQATKSQNQAGSLRLKDQVAVVTGSGRGIGRAISEALAAEGARIVISDINEELCKATQTEMGKEGIDVIGVACNVTDNASIDAMVEAVTAKWGRIDILVNNAGITRDGLLMRMSEDDWNAVIATNLSSAFKVTKAVIKVMSKQKS